MSLNEKTKKLKLLIRKMDRVLVAFSGGVDSTLVLAIAKDVLGSNVLAVTAHSDSLPDREVDACRKLSQEIGVEHLFIHTEEMSCLLYTSPSPRDQRGSRMPSSA